MNELFDKLILRIIFTLFMIFMLYAYRYAHVILYPSAKQKLLKRFFPAQNSSETIHLMSRILGIGIIFSEFYFFISDGIVFALIDFFIEATLAFCLYLISIFILDSIVLYNFEFEEEILKKKNFAYALVTLAHSLCTAYLIKVVLAVSNHSMIMFIFLWLFGIVLIGFSTKTFSHLSKLPFNRLLVQKNLGVSISYLGFLFGWTIIISSALNNELADVSWYSVQTLLKIVLSLIIIPIFRKGLLFVYRLQEEITPEIISEASDKQVKSLGYGVFEGISFFSSCYLTTVITGNINFGTFYPVF
jgi:uncharacterized membrane protein YjfL (UPF0719 family)